MFRFKETAAKFVVRCCVGATAVGAASCAVAVSAAESKESTAYKYPEQQLKELFVPIRHYHPSVLLLDNLRTRSLLTYMRDASTSHVDYVKYSDRLMNILMEWGLLAAGVTAATVQTPCGEFRGAHEIPASDICVVSIVRSGDALLETARRIAPAISVGKILIQRDESTADKRPKLFYVKVPHDIKTKMVLLVDPMLATGGSAVKAIEQLVALGVKPENITFVNVVSCYDGLAHLGKAYPQVRVVTTAIDPDLNEHKYIVPGLGDFGDRYYSTPN